MFTVALIGPDGCGKTTACRRLEHSLPFPAKYVYMGVNLEASNYVLPTTRLICEMKRLFGGRPDLVGPRDPSRHQKPKNWVKRMIGAVKTNLRMANQIAEEWFRPEMIALAVLGNLNGFKISRDELKC